MDYANMPISLSKAASTSVLALAVFLENKDEYMDTNSVVIEYMDTNPVLYLNPKFRKINNEYFEAKDKLRNANDVLVAAETKAEEAICNEANVRLKYKAAKKKRKLEEELTST